MEITAKFWDTDTGNTFEVDVLNLTFEECAEIARDNGMNRATLFDEDGDERDTFEFEW